MNRRDATLTMKSFINKKKIQNGGSLFLIVYKKTKKSASQKRILAQNIVKKNNIK